MVRNDLTRSDDHPDPVLVHEAIDESPGLELVATFGPTIGGGAHINGDLGRAVVNGGWQNDVDAIEIYAVNAPASAAVGTDEAPIVVGGPEDVLDLTDLGVVDADVPTRLAADVGEDGADGADGAPVILTDGNRSVVRHFGRIHDATSAVRTRQQAEAPQETVPDYLLPDPDRWSTFVEYDGIEGVRASSSLAQAGPAPTARGRLPFAALDGHAETSWQSVQSTDEHHWWQVDLADEALPPTIEVTGALMGEQEVSISTDDWTSDPIVLVPETPTRIVLGDEASPFLRVTDTASPTNTPLALAEVDLPGVQPVRRLRLPPAPSGTGAPSAIVLRSVSDARTGCAAVDLDVRCVEGREGSSEEPFDLRRLVDVATPASYAASMRVRPIPGPALDELLQQDSLVGVRASSTGVSDVRASALAAVDGDAGTTWSAALSDVRPTLELRWVKLQRLSEIRLQVDADTDARRPESLVLRWPGGRREIELDDDGRADFPTIRTDRLLLEVGDAEPVTSVNFAGVASPAPVGITDLSLPGAQALPAILGDQLLDLPCGSGPELTVDGATTRTAVRASARELFTGELVSVVLCDQDTVALDEGTNQVDVTASDAFAPVSVVLSRSGLPLGASSPVPGTSDGRGHQRLEPAPDQAIIAGHENTNAGWRATQDGADLSPVVVDGWRQGWRTNAEGPTTLEASFAPGRTYVAALIVGLLAALALVAGIALGRRGRSRGTGTAACTERAVPSALVLVVPVVGLLLGAGIGMAVALVTAGLVWGLHRGRGALASGLLAALVGAALMAYALQPWGGLGGWAGGQAWPSYVVVAVVSGLLTLVGADSRRRTLPWRRRAGISTTR